MKQIKALIPIVLAGVITLVIWEMFVKKLVLKNSYEDYFDEPKGDCLGVDRYLRKLA